MEFFKYMLDGNIVKGVVFIFMLSAALTLIKYILHTIESIFQKPTNNFYISEKNIDEKFIEELKKYASRVEE